jgi:hypothetical protein
MNSSAESRLQEAGMAVAIEDLVRRYEQLRVRAHDLRRHL